MKMDGDVLGEIGGLEVGNVGQILLDFIVYIMDF